MILYFSATGNTEFIAKELAKRLDDECINLLERVKKNDHSPLYSKKPYIICAPVYVCEIPRFMTQYLKEQVFTGSKDVYCIFTSGGYAGISGVLAKSLFTAKNMIYHGHAEFKMPRNYVANDAYPMLERPEIEKRILDSYEQLEKVASDILSGKKLTARHVFLFESIITIPFNPIWCKYKLTAKDFYVKENCIGCGKCERLCPLNNIKITDKKPVWGDQCTHCMACIGNCPVQAIEYGTITQNKDQYNFGKYRYVVNELKKQ
ncbi:MAG: (4Fe-4S)-binding protein [Erysipelotrichaceae bacterium]|nr:(4Fe-4S)-binding protein [Erysipelotrichaceae bacterium]